MTDYVKAYNDKTSPYYSKAHELVNWADKDTYVVDGVIRWVNNDNVPPLEILELLYYKADVVFDITASCRANHDDMIKAVTRYRETRANMTEANLIEEAFERQAAFGKGVTVVDVITGEEYVT